jgi:hypothetical protein
MKRLIRCTYYNYLYTMKYKMGCNESRICTLIQKKHFKFNKECVEEYMNKLPIISNNNVKVLNNDLLCVNDYNMLAGFIGCKENEQILFVYSDNFELYNTVCIKIGEYEYIGCTNYRIFGILLTGSVVDTLFENIQCVVCEFEESDVHIHIHTKNYIGSDHAYYMNCKKSCRFFCDFINTLVINNKLRSGLRKQNDLPPAYVE